MQARESVAVRGRSDRPEVSGQRRIRLFLDSNVITRAIVSPWGMDKAVLSLCAARVCKLVLAEAVRDEMEGNLLIHVERLSPSDADDLIEDYRRLIKLTNPELVPYPDKRSVHSNRAINSTGGRRSGAAFGYRQQAGLASNSQHQALHAGCGTTYRLTHRHSRRILQDPFFAVPMTW